MKKNKYIYSKILLFLGLILSVIVGCDRNPSDDVEFATFPNTADVFIDGFTGGLDYFPFEGSYFEAFTVDKETKYKGSAAMRFDVPNLGDPKGPYAGAIFRVGTERDLTGFDALTFWAKGTRPGKVNEIGFGQDFGENKYLVTTDLQLTTTWKKYVIPIPDASKLIAEKGLFWYAEGPENGEGYTFWIDELRFEKLGTIAQPRPSILKGVNAVAQSFIGSNITLTDLTQTFNLASGINQTVTAAPSYFTFKSSNVDVARVSELGVVSIVGAGTAKITASMGSVTAAGSLTVNTLGGFTAAPTPIHLASNVISIFSNTYTNQPVEYYNGYWAPYQTTLGQDDIHINGNDVIKYSELNFVGIQFTQPTINVSQMTHFHIDVQVVNAIPSGGFLTIKLQDIGPDNTFGTSDDSAGEIKYTSPFLVTGSWVSLDVSLSSFPGLNGKSNLAQVVFVSDATIKDILVDNIYFHK